MICFTDYNFSTINNMLAISYIDFKRRLINQYMAFAHFARQPSPTLHIGNYFASFFTPLGFGKLLAQGSILTMWRAQCLKQISWSTPVCCIQPTNNINTFSRDNAIRIAD